LGLFLVLVNMFGAVNQKVYRACFYSSLYLFAIGLTHFVLVYHYLIKDDEGNLP